jgi:hypothetical protein
MSTPSFPDASSRDLSFLAGAAEKDIHPARLAELEDGLWSTNHSSIADYTARAGDFEGQGTIETLISKYLGTMHGNVGLDLAAGNGQALSDLLNKGLLDLALTTSYQSPNDEAAIRDRHIAHISGNLVLTETWNRILDWQEQNAPDGLALVMHRPVGALQDLPFAAYAGAAHLLLSRIRPGGLMFAQVPRPLFYDKHALAEVQTSIHRRIDVSCILANTVWRPGGPDTHAVIVKR